jgi:hypothetical protein
MNWEFQKYFGKQNEKKEFKMAFKAKEKDKINLEPIKV